MLIKISCDDIAKSASTMDKWPKNVPIKECDNACKFDKNRNRSELPRSNLELSTDPI